MPAQKKALTPSVFTDSDPDFAKGCVDALADKTKAPPLRGRFTVPPFTILSTQQDYWRELNRQWVQDIGLSPAVVWGYNEVAPPLDIALDELSEGIPLSRRAVSGILDFYKGIRRFLVEGSFCVVPTTMWSARQGYWQRVKRHWIYNIGLRGERGRSEIGVEGVNKNLEPGGGGGPNSVWLGRKPDAVPGGGGPRSVRRRAANDLGKCFGSGNPGDLGLGFKRERETK